jgi:hypothetical protein
VLKRKDKLLLVEVITGWARDVLVGGLPEGIWELRNALFNDLHDAPT